MITDPTAAAAFDKLLMSDLEGDVDKTSTGPDTVGEIDSPPADAGPDQEAEDADESSPDDSGELDEPDAPEAPGEPGTQEGDRFKDGSGKTEAGKAHREAERELGRKANEIAELKSRLAQREAELSSLNRQLQQQRLTDPAQLSPERYEALTAEAQRQGFDTPEDYIADQRIDFKVQEKLGSIQRSIAFSQAQAYAATLADMDKIGPRVAELLEESGALDAVPLYLDAPEQARQMKQAIELAHLRAHNEHLLREGPKQRRAAEQRAEREAAQRRAGKQASSAAAPKAAVPSPGATPERSPAAELLSGGGHWYDNIRK